MNKTEKFLLYTLTAFTLGVTSSCTTFNKTQGIGAVDPSMNVIESVEDIVLEYHKEAQKPHNLIRPDLDLLRSVVSKINHYQNISEVKENKTLNQVLANSYAMSYDFRSLDGIKHNFDIAVRIYENNDFNPELLTDLKVLNDYARTILDSKSVFGLPSEEAKNNLLERIVFHGGSSDEKTIGNDISDAYPNNNLGFKDELEGVFLESQLLSSQIVMHKYDDKIQGITYANTLLEKYPRSYICPDLHLTKAQGYSLLAKDLVYDHVETVEYIEKTGFDNFLINRLDESRMDIEEQKKILSTSANVEVKSQIYKNMCNLLEIQNLQKCVDKYIGSPQADLASEKIKILYKERHADFQLKK
jgi:hypothetical protein